MSLESECVFWDFTSRVFSHMTTTEHVKYIFVSKKRFQAPCTYVCFTERTYRGQVSYPITAILLVQGIKSVHLYMMLSFSLNRSFTSVQMGPDVV